MSAVVETRREAWGFPEAVVFVAGISTLGAEIAAARLIAPAFGASTVVWANTIAVVLLALAVGYWVGGRLADRHPRGTVLCAVVLAAAALLACVPLAAAPLLGGTQDALSELWGSLLAMLVLVAPPVLVLGAVAPWAIRLRLAAVEDAGEVAGPGAGGGGAGGGPGGAGRGGGPGGGPRGPGRVCRGPPPPRAVPPPPFFSPPHRPPASPSSASRPCSPSRPYPGWPAADAHGR